jgi:hypothetical protein
MNQSQHIIDRLGGPTKVAELLGWSDKPGQVQRIQNWKTRGIPARVLLDHQDVFGAAVVETPKEPANV